MISTFSGLLLVSLLRANSTMDFQGPRAALLQGIGALAAGLGSFGFRASNNEFSGRKINQFRCSKLLYDGMVIGRFYVYETLIQHNFVVFQTTSRYVFKVHLIADVLSNRRRSPITVDIVPTHWKPGGRRVSNSRRRAGDLKRFVKYQVQRFGAYEVGFNDCRHFAQAVADFLAS